MSAQVAADLRAAADVLRRDGWTQGAYKAPGGCRCVTGALIFVASDGTGSSPQALRSTADYQRFLPARNAFGRLIHDYLLASWNDEPGRTADEVIAALEAAADAAEDDQ